MDIILPEILTGIIGLKCNKARLTYAGGLQIGFGDKKYYKEPKLKNLFITEWELITLNCAWRCIENNYITCSSFDSEEDSSLIIEGLLNNKLENIQQIKHDVILEFENGLIIELLGQSSTEPVIEFYCPNEIYLELTGGNWIQTKTTTSSEGLTQDEEIMSTHSEQCSNRWHKQINNSKEKCNNCAYYLPIRGRFHFWDFGICSNKNSINDGKLVLVNTGCIEHNEQLIL